MNKYNKILHNIIMKNKLVILILLLFFFICTYRLYDLCIINKDKYNKQYLETTKRIVIISDSPRGKILDVNGKVLVDNKGINTLVYNKLDNIDNNDLEVAKKVAKVIDLDISNIDINILKKYYLKVHNDGNDLITKKEKTKYKNRFLSKKEIDDLKYKRVTNTMIDSMSDIDKKASIIYNIINNGYSYEDKVIKKDISDIELSKINDLNIKGLRTTVMWERVYPYGNTIRSILGNIGAVPYEEKSSYEKKGVPLNSLVGISYLEKEYDDYLRGTNSKYEYSFGKLKLIKKGDKGKDLVLSIDIDKVLYLQSILEEEIIKAKKAPNSENFDRSYVVLGNPSTGNIIAMLGLKYVNGSFIDITKDIVSESYTVGSVVKGATIGVGYKNNLIKIDEYVNDSCIKLKNEKEKCSYKRLGRINDLKALAYSSNYYQFIIATRLANPTYKYNGLLNANSDHFKVYRDMLASYGLGSKTGIDLPNETSGLKGKKISDDLLLNLAIGQYDSYTPIELFQYISTIANNGTKVTPRIKNEPGKIISKVDLNPEYIDRIKLGLKSVMEFGTGKNYTNKSFTSAGKTGTSETFLDTNLDGQIDTETISTSFAMFMPYENPEYAYIIVSPNIATKKSEHTYKYSINLQVTRKFSQYLFENN